MPYTFTFTHLHLHICIYTFAFTHLQYTFVADLYIGWVFAYAHTYLRDFFLFAFPIVNVYLRPMCALSQISWRVLRTFVDIQITDRQIADTKM
jgi:hypothetical protein